MHDKILLGERIATARKAKGLSSAQLATRIGVKKSTILNWESGKSAPRANRLTHLAGVLDVPLLWIIGGADMPPTIDTPNLNETQAIESKLGLAEEMLHDLSALLVDIRGQVRRVQRTFDNDEI
ncbi:MAG: hypothetical protein DHS20C01_26700 [marine bacterium B5-7]|nr:MAG: hypothetical protein DHS20C01_26700 [marine bacterium B5-7]